jgi:hypothetical protein
MAQLLSNYSSALKEVLLPYIVDNFPTATILLDQMKRNTGVQFINDEFIAPVWSGRHGGIGNLANDGNSIVSAGGRSTTRGTVAVKIVTGAFDISKLTIDASKTSQGAVEAALTAHADTLVTDFSRHVNRQLFDGGIGVVAQLRQTGGSVSGTEAALEAVGNGTGADDGRVVDRYGTINGDDPFIEYFAPSMHIGIGTAGAVAGTVAAVTGTTIQFTGTLSLAASDSVYILDGSNQGAGTSEITGIRAALSSTTGTNTYAGIARNVTGWTPQFGSSSEALSLSRMENAYLKARRFGKVGDKYAIFVNTTLYQKYGDLLTAMRREVNNADLLGGWTGLEFAAGGGKVGVFLDYQVPDGEVLVLDMDSWTLCQVNEPQWVEEPSSAGALLRLQNTLTYQAVMHWFTNVICLSPAANAKETRKTN